MTDLEMTKLCAEAMGDLPAMVEHEGEMRFGYASCMGPAYDPLHNDAQAMALVKKFGLAIQPPYFDMKAGWHVWKEPRPNCTAIGHDLNRAIVECVAKMQVDRTESINRGTATLNKSLYG